MIFRKRAARLQASGAKAKQVEWVIYLKNEGSADTPILSDIQALDCSLNSPDAEPIIQYAKGATCSIEDFRPMARTLGTRGELHLPAKPDTALVAYRRKN